MNQNSSSGCVHKGPSFRPSASCNIREFHQGPSLEKATNWGVFNRCGKKGCTILAHQVLLVVSRATVSRLITRTTDAHVESCRSCRPGNSNQAAFRRAWQLRTLFGWDPLHSWTAGKAAIDADSSFKPQNNHEPLWSPTRHIKSYKHDSDWNKLHRHRRFKPGSLPSPKLQTARGLGTHRPLGLGLQSMWVDSDSESLNSD